jgi:PilZ domain
MPDSFGYLAVMSQSKDPCAAIRWGERLPVDLPVSIQLGGGPDIAGRLLNVSVSGALIEADALLAPPVNVSVAIDTSIRGHDHHMNLAAVVVRCSGGYLGLEWRDMACQPLVELLQASDS